MLFVTAHNITSYSRSLRQLPRYRKYVATLFTHVFDNSSDQIHTYMMAHSLYPEFQSAHRKNHSTETALVRVTNDILMKMNTQDITFLVMLDLSARLLIQSIITSSLHVWMRSLGYANWPWLIHDRLLLNDDKTEFIITGTRQQLNKLRAMNIWVGSSEIKPGCQVKNLSSNLSSSSGSSNLKSSSSSSSSPPPSSS